MPSLIYGYGLTGKSFQKYLDIKGENFEIYDALNNDSLKFASKIKDGFYKNIYVAYVYYKKNFFILWDFFYRNTLSYTDLNKLYEL